MSKIDKIKTNFVNTVFNDIDQHSEFLNQWDVDFKQLEPGKINVSMMVLADNEFQAFNASYDKTLLQNGSCPKNLITFGIPRNNSTPFFWRGKKIAGNNICIFPINGEIDSETKAGFDVYGISFSPCYIDIVCEEMHYPHLFEKIRNTEVVTISYLSMNFLQRFLTNIFVQLPNQIDDLSDSQFIETIKYEILKQLLHIIEKHLNTSKALAVRLRDEAFKKAKSYILENIDEPITVKKLVEETGVTERTLERAFLERFESTPKTVLKSFRLSGVNKELKRTNVANGWSFWHMGQFAKDYKKMFGELPSETLNS